MHIVEQTNEVGNMVEDDQLSLEAAEQQRYLDEIKKVSLSLFSRKRNTFSLVQRIHREYRTYGNRSFKTPRKNKNIRGS